MRDKSIREQVSSTLAKLKKNPPLPASDSEGETTLHNNLKRQRQNLDVATPAARRKVSFEGDDGGDPDDDGDDEQTGTLTHILIICMY